MPDGDLTALDAEDRFFAVRNDLGQYSVWWADRPPPAGWTAIGPSSTRAACLDRISLLWTGLGPLQAGAEFGDGPPGPPAVGR